MSALPLPPHRRVALLRAVDTYALGHVTAELRERQGYLGGADQADVQRYLTGVLESGQYPHLARFRHQDLGLVGEDARESFAEGLEWLLAGIAAAIGAAFGLTGQTLPSTRVIRTSRTTRSGLARGSR